MTADGALTPRNPAQAVGSAFTRSWYKRRHPVIWWFEMHVCLLPLSSAVLVRHLQLFWKETHSPLTLGPLLPLRCLRLRYAADPGRETGELKKKERKKELLHSQDTVDQQVCRL